jgi:hypothetical protein
MKKKLKCPKDKCEYYDLDNQVCSLRFGRDWNSSHKSNIYIRDEEDEIKDFYRKVKNE